MAAPGDLLEFLRQQRWFGAKGAAPKSARIVDSVPLPTAGGRYSFARAVVETDDGERSYQLVMATDGSTFDATHHDTFRKGLIAALNTGARAESGALRWIAEPVSGVTPPSSDLPTKLGSAEQSNTSILVGDQAIIKLFRTLQPGIHPDVEVTRFLTTRAGFANTPRLIASASFQDERGSYVAAMMQELVPGAIDAWSYALEQSREYFAAPKGKDLPIRFVEDARGLGQITRAMHDALASDADDPAFAPDEVEAEDLDRWALRTKHMIQSSLTLLEKQLKSATFPKDRLAEAQALIRRREHFLAWIDEIDDALSEDAGAKIRTHGDYHLGQVLRSANADFMVIDFEGEPSRPLEERREKTSALRDVAGMLRSFAYAAATLATEQKQLDLATRELRTARWERDVRAAYLEGYLGAADEDDADILPEERDHVKKLISLFEAEKAFYELAYELNNRPAWVWSPRRGISMLFH
jgi:trehalose synthase-fused probable maltokinase